MDIRILQPEDFDLVSRMNTGIEDDYVLRVFERLTTDRNHLFGLFVEDKLAVIGGYTIFKGKYAMLGRLRSDLSFRGQNLATELNNYLIDKAFQIEGIEWVGANTKEDNGPANKVLQKIGFEPKITLHGAQTRDLQPLLQNGQTWREVTDLVSKQQLIQSSLVNRGKIFPYECYYPFPSSKQLFTDDEVDDWKFFINDNETRFFILKIDQKKHRYCHIVYPWNDLHKQTGLWETVDENYQKLQREYEEDIYVWIDLTKKEVEQLPNNQPFRLPAAWVLYGMTREEYTTKIGAPGQQRTNLVLQNAGGFSTGH